MAGDETEAARVREAIARLEGRSPLQDWLRRNRAELEARFAVSRPRWAGVAKLLAELGVVDANGQPPKPHAVRLAWSRVRASSPSPSQATATAPPVPDIEPPLPAPVQPVEATVPPPDVPPDPPRPRFKLGSLR